MLNVLIVDDHAVVRRGLRQILEEELDTALCAEASNADEALRLLCAQPWDVVVLDITLPDRSGLDVLREARRRFPLLPVLVLSMHPEDQYAIRVLKSGASGYMTKESAPEDLVKAVKAVLQGGRYVSPSIAGKMLDDLGTGSQLPLHETLSVREYQVLCLLGSGKTLTQIGHTLELSVKTVGTYRSRLLNKMRMSNNAQLMAYAIRHGLVP